MNTRELKLKSSLPFHNLAETSQIIIPGTNTKYHFKNRMTHVEEVRVIGDLIARQIKFKKRDSLALICLSHDLGHPPFGHSGQKVLDRVSKEFGIDEGFSDNNNNLNVIWNNNIEMNMYEQVSLIKYPSKLYKEQQNILLPVLDKYIQKEKTKWGENLSRTVACEIMDIADEIAYGLSDLFDGFTNQYNINEIDIFFTNEIQSSQIYKSDLILLCTAAQNNDNRLLREVLLNLKIKLIKDTYWNYNLARIEFKNDESRQLLSRIIQFNYDYFISHEKVVKARKKALMMFESYINYMFKCNEDEVPSKLYKTKLKDEKDPLNKLKIRRDMIADSSDQYVLSFFSSAF